MLTIEQYGVKLTRLCEEDIELVRYWRNQQSVKVFMSYREYITPVMQQKWFSSINNKFNYYFIIEFDNKKVGLINAKDFKPEIGYGEGGIFIWDKEYINSFAAVFSTLCFLNFLLIEAKVCKLSRARILKDNDRAIHYNKLIGYKLLPAQEQVENQLYELNVDDYLLYGTKLNKAAAILNEGDSELKYTGEVSDLNPDEINRLLHKKVSKGKTPF